MSTKTMAEVERAHILKTLEECGWFRERAAQALGIAPRTLYSKLKKYEDQGFLAPTTGRCKKPASGAAHRDLKVSTEVWVALVSSGADPDEANRVSREVARLEEK